MAEGWDERYITPQVYKNLENLVAQFALKKNARVLDVGTGTGVLLPALLKCIGSDGFINAIDYSWNMIHKAFAKHSKNTNLHFCVSSVFQLPFNASLFDYVICFGAFPHFEDQSRALSEMHRMLYQGGELLLLMRWEVTN